MTSLEVFLLGMVVLLTIFVMKLTIFRLEMAATLTKLQQRNRELKVSVDNTYGDLLRVVLRLGKYHNHGIEERLKADSKTGEVEKFFCVQTPDVVLLYEYAQRHEHVFKDVPVFQINTAPKKRRNLRLIK